MESNHKAAGCSDSVKPRILVVEDSPDISDLLREAFRHLPEYDSVFAETGTEALNIFTASIRCCENTGVLMDLVLPDINGLRLLSAFREIEKGSARGCTPSRFGLISANTHVAEGTDLIKRVGVTLRLDKPFDLVTFKDRVEEWITSPPPDLYALCAGASVSTRRNVSH